MRAITTLAVAVLPLLLGVPAAASHAGEATPDPATCPMHAQHTAHAADTAQAGTAAADLDRRGDTAMGFAHERTTHHFRLAADGGSIEVQADDPADTESRDQIRAHLADIARRFAAGDFASPFAVHARVLPGVPEMTRLAAAIHYSYEELERGGRVVIRTDDPAAREAVHAFLRAQIADHQTGDPG